MAVETVVVQIAVPKEGKDVVDAVAALISALVEKKPLADFAALLPGVMSAVDGVGKVGEEVKSVYNDELAAYLVQKVFSALKGPEAIQL